MDDPIVGLTAALCGMGMLLVVIVAVIGVRGQRRRRARMRQWADRHGWTLTRRPAVDWGRSMPGGNPDGIEHLFTRVIDGRRVDVAEYSVTDAGDGSTQNTHHWVVTATTLRWPLPGMSLAPRDPVSRLARKLFGGEDTATGDRDFDRRFRVRAGEPAAVRRWLSGQLIAAQLAGRVPPAWQVHGAGLLCHRPGALDLDEIPAHAAATVTLAGLLEDGGR